MPSRQASVPAHRHSARLIFCDMGPGPDHSTVAHDIAAIAVRLHDDARLRWMVGTIRAMLDAAHEDGCRAA